MFVLSVRFFFCCSCLRTWNCKELHLVHFLLSVEFSMHLDILEICHDTSGVLDLLLVPLKSVYLVY